MQNQKLVRNQPSTEQTETENNELLDIDDDQIITTNSSTKDHKKSQEGKNKILNQNGESTSGKRGRKKYKCSSLAIAASTLAPSTSSGTRSTASSPSQGPSRSSSASVSGASTPSAPAAAYSQEALRDLVCSTLAPAAAANLIKSDKREEKKRKSQSNESPAEVIH